MKKNLIILLVCAAMIAAGFIFQGDNKGEYLPTTATVSRIDTVFNTGTGDDNGTEYYVYVDYTVDGTEYKDVELNGGYHAGLKEGSPINIEYRADNPNHARTPFAKFVPYLLWGLGGLGILYFLVMLVFGLKKR